MGIRHRQQPAAGGAHRYSRGDFWVMLRALFIRDAKVVLPKD
jgi:hypothetical protein